MEYPDARKHRDISFLKSGVRIIGFALLPIDIVWAAIFLIGAEALGIIEELV